MRSITHFLLSAALSFFACSKALAEDAVKPEEIRVGIILPLSGEVAAIGNAVKNGIEMAYQSLPPEQRDHMKLYYEDDQFQAKNSVTAINHLMSDKHINVLINPSSGTGNALAPIAENKQLPFFAIATDPKVSDNRKYVFNIWVSVEAETQAVMKEIEKRQYKRIARIATVHDMMTAVKRTFDAQSAGSISIALDEEYPSDVKDFKTFLTKVKTRGKIDAIAAFLFPGQVGLFAKQARELGITLPLFGYELFEDPGEVKVSGGALIGQWYVNTDDPTGDFSKDYTKRFPGAATFGSANGHDAILLIAAAASKGIAMKDLPTYLSTVKDFKGALGTFSAAPNNRFTLPAAIKVVTKDGFEKLPG